MASEQWVLTGEMSQGIDAALRKFIGDSRARCALLITHSGQLVGQVGFTAHLNVLSLCALVAGIFTTTQELLHPPSTMSRTFGALLSQRFPRPAGWAPS